MLTCFVLHHDAMLLDDRRRLLLAAEVANASHRSALGDVLNDRDLHGQSVTGATNAQCYDQAGTAPGCRAPDDVCQGSQRSWCLQRGLRSHRRRLDHSACATGCDILHLGLEREFSLSEEVGLNPQPLPPRELDTRLGHASVADRTVVVSIPEKVNNNIEGLTSVVAAVVDKLGCKACCSGLTSYSGARSTTWRSTRSSMCPALAASARAPRLGVGLIYSTAIEPLLERYPELVDVLEFEPQTTWVPRDGGYVANEQVLQRLMGLPGRKLIHSVGAPVGGTMRPQPEQLVLLRDAVERFQSPWLSEHLSFNRTPEFATGFFLPPRQTAHGVRVARRRSATCKRHCACRLPSRPERITCVRGQMSWKMARSLYRSPKPRTVESCWICTTSSPTPATAANRSTASWSSFH